jgi:hypothetical protein
MELFQAHRQWAVRPDDQRFGSIQALYDATKAYADSAVEQHGVPLSSMRTAADSGDVVIVGRKNIPSRLTHWAFGQLCQRVGTAGHSVPASYLRNLPATLAVQNLNHAMAHRLSQDGQASVSMLFHQNGGLLCRAITGDVYSRFWNWEVAERLLDLEARGWQPARPDVRQIDDKLPLYASDHDLFCFLRHGERTISEPGNPDGLHRGIIVENSEVGDSALNMLRFLYREMCGNHIIWGASEVINLKVRHVGKVRDRVREWDMAISRYMNESAGADEAKIASAKHRLIAGTAAEVLDAIFGKRAIGLSRRVIEAGMDAVHPEVDGDPRSVWGVVNGLTRYSQTIPYADQRTEIDRAAGRILDVF